ncbi:MAG: amylo-alpha-1,6-glucosidase [Phycisphaerales bacterium JB040]
MSEVTSEIRATVLTGGCLEGGERSGAVWPEWVIANGLGGFAMGTALGVNTRRYHGLLVAAMRPPVGRAMILSQVADVLRIERPSESPVELRMSGFHFVGEGLRVMAHPALERFEHDGAARWVYRFETPVGVVRVVKSLEVADGHNGCALRYDVETGVGGGEGHGWTLELTPLVGLRDVHELREGSGERLTSRELATPEGRPGVLVASRDGEHLGVHISADAGRFESQKRAWRSVEYVWEKRRGLDGEESLWSPGTFVCGSERGEGSVTLSASVEGVEQGAIAAHTRRERVGELVERVVEGCPGAKGSDRDRLARLAAATDLFVVKRVGEARVGGGSEGPKRGWGVSVIAGYPWFTDWGRDTMIALDGLLLATGRHEEAGRTLATFAGARRRGLIPNNFDDRGGGASYNTVDASLWFVHACGRYVEATGDRALLESDLLPACEEIVRCYSEGTDYAIGADADGLIAGGDDSTQLTWMDAKRDGVTFTPRFGKAVEINALWHHALVTLAGLVGEPERAGELREMAARVRASFARVFGDGRSGLVDRVEPEGDGGWRASDEVRVNQVFAAGLAHGPLDDAGRAGVLGVVERELLTDAGLRTLAPGSAGYRGRFEGDLFERDGAYHNGTVWPWLVGAYAEGVLRAGGFDDASRETARGALRPVIDRLGVDAVNSIPEVYDGDEPRRWDGCVAQAWSVAECLRGLVLSFA